MMNNKSHFLSPYIYICPLLSELTKITTGASPFFFFSSRRRHTRSDRDWSSDVCSSDLKRRETAAWRRRAADDMDDDIDAAELLHNGVRNGRAALGGGDVGGHEMVGRPQREIGRASCRERVEISVVAVSLKKKKLDESAH